MGKRSDGEGSAPIQRPDGRWIAQLRVGTKVVDGKKMRIRKTVYGATKKECAGNLKAELKALDEGTIVLGKINTLEQWMEHWLLKIAPRKVRPSTLAAYRSIINTWIIPHLGEVKLNKLTPEHLDDLYDEMRLGGLADATILKGHRILSRAMTVAVHRGKLGSNPCSRMDAPTAEKHEITPITPQDARALLRAAKDGPPSRGDGEVAGRPHHQILNSARWTVALALGLRQGEALGLCWDMVDLSGGTIRVSRGWLRAVEGRPAQLGPLKTKGSNRTITIPQTLVAELKKHRREQNVIRFQEGPNWIGYQQEGREYDLVFSGRDGRPVGHAADTRRWKSLLVLAEVPDARLHDARHTAATMMLVQGVPSRVVMEILGHSTITLTLETYSHVVPELAADAAAKIERGLTG